MRWVLLWALCLGFMPVAAPAQQAPEPAAATASAPSAAEAERMLAEEREQRRQAQWDKAIAEAKLEVIKAGSSRLELWIGIFGLLITLGLALAALFTWKAAANAARAEVQDVCDKIERVAESASKLGADIEKIAGEADKLRTQIAGSKAQADTDAGRGAQQLGRRALVSGWREARR